MASKGWTEYKKLLLEPEWEKRELELFEKAGYKCSTCGDDENGLKIRHKAYGDSKPPWEYGDENFLVLCKHCHSVLFNLDVRNNDIDTDIHIQKVKFRRKSSIMLFISYKDEFIINIWSDGWDRGGFEIGEDDLRLLVKMINNSLPHES